MLSSVLEEAAFLASGRRERLKTELALKQGGTDSLRGRGGVDS